MIKPQLALDKHLSQLPKDQEWVVQEKLDGVRCIAIIKRLPITHEIQVSLFSREGKLYNNFPHIEKSLSEFPAGTIFDGEITMGSFKELSTQLHRKENVNAGDAVYNIFDVLMYGGEEKKSLPYLHRILFVHELFLASSSSLIGLKAIPWWIRNSSEIEADYKSVINNGGEGLVIKKTNSPYQEGRRCSDWIKLKSKDFVTLSIVNIIEGEGKLKDTCGSIVCKGRDKDRDYLVSFSGQSMTKGIRDLLWNQWVTFEPIQKVEIVGDYSMYNEDLDYWTLRHPRFFRFIGEIDD